ncbi:MAG: leucine--tRNA ligase, partial [Acidobacteria bacterium]|nr:leucine--tRNA ligase [Acidobacteriota bacterium]
MGKQEYDFEAIEVKWQRLWEESRAFEVREDTDRPKYYVLEMLPYPSGKLHMGHVRNYSMGDVLARFKTMNGFNVLHPIGWDAFGLPAENAAIKHQTHPEKWTLDNTAHGKSQIRRWGISYDWRREVTTCLPEYYRWNQWFFLKMYERGLAYKKRSLVNWCHLCQTVLANEQVEGGRCWRDQSLVVQKELEQWFLKITDYADELLQETYRMSGWPEKVLVMQRNWIGKSEGTMVEFPVAGREVRLAVFTTRVDTIYGATALLLAPQHPMLPVLLEGSPRKDEILSAADSLRQQVVADRSLQETEKQGFFTGVFATNPFSGENVSIWIANFVLMEYGTGAVMSVPAHDQRDFEFAQNYRLPVKVVIFPEGKELKAEEMQQAYEEFGVVVNSGPFSGLKSQEAIPKMSRWCEENAIGKSATTYRLKDWGISRQRFWGTPIPIIYCEGCGAVPVPDADLPVLLPKVAAINSAGGSPLANIKEFLETTCPRCGKPARRDTDTMDTFVDSSWYFYRYTDARIATAPINPQAVAYWFPVDRYIGGIEHAILHLIYMRFWTKMMRDLGLIDFDEPVTNLFTQGMVCKDGAAMSKSKGNVVDPDEIVSRYGADTLRLFILFMAPPEKDLEWSDQGLEGCSKFLNRVYRVVSRHQERARGVAGVVSPPELTEAGRKLLRKVHQTIRKVTVDIGDRFHINTALSAIMELVNEIYLYEALEESSEASSRLIKQSLEAVVLLLSPMA